jgi:hypothetical protein
MKTLPILSTTFVAHLIAHFVDFGGWLRSVRPLAASILFMRLGTSRAPFGHTRHSDL